MKKSISFFYTLILVAASWGSAGAQIDEICREFVTLPSFDSPFAHVPYVFGRVTVGDGDPVAKSPKVTVTLADNQQSPLRITVDRSGNYCFKRKTNSGSLFVEIDGIEVARRTLISSGPAQQREDFEITASRSDVRSPPGVISAGASRPRNDKTLDLYRDVISAEAERDTAKTIKALHEIVAVDPADYVAWAKLGAVYFQSQKIAEADAAFRKSLESNVEYIPSWISVGRLRIAQKQYSAAIEILNHAISLDPSAAGAYQLLGEAYLMTRQGALGAEALKKALELDPIGLAECHLQLAHLYELAGAKKLATKEYKAFLAKVSEHPEKKKFEKYIRDNPE